MNRDRKVTSQLVVSQKNERAPRKRRKEMSTKCRRAVHQRQRARQPAKYRKVKHQATLMKMYWWYQATQTYYLHVMWMKKLFQNTKRLYNNTRLTVKRAAHLSRKRRKKSSGIVPLHKCPERLAVPLTLNHELSVGIFKVYSCLRRRVARLKKRRNESANRNEERERGKKKPINNKTKRRVKAEKNKGRRRKS